MRESKHLEYKEAVSNSFLKTVSAYANYGTGEIVFGVSDDGAVKGVENPKTVCLDIENRINDSIAPVPEYTLRVNPKTSVITLTVFEGLYKPYLYKAKAYRRNDSSTIAVDRLALGRLILEGQNLSFEELPAENQKLTFHTLGEKLKASLHLEEVTMDTLKTLELYKDGNGFNHAGELLADANGFCGVDIVRFGDNISVIRDRETYAKESVLQQYDHALTMFKKYYQYEQIKGSYREPVFLIPEEAFREALANAIVHREWDVDTHINIAMFADRIEITSPGGLPKGLDAEEYRRGGISILRNRILGGVFLRLGMIEQFGTGIRRIHEAYQSSAAKPTFDATENSIRIVLPVLRTQNNLTEDENRVYSLLKGRTAPSSEVVDATGFGKSKTVAILKKLVAEGFITASGKGRGIKYTGI